MEQNLVSDEELIERINKVLHETKRVKKSEGAEIRQEDTIAEKFQDVYEATALENTDGSSSEVEISGEQINLVPESHYLSLQLQAENKKSKELQSKFKLFEDSVKYFERLNGKLETIKRAVDEDCQDTEKDESGVQSSSEAMQKIRHKTIHTATSGVVTAQDQPANENINFSEPRVSRPDSKQKIKQTKEEVTFRDAEDFKQLEEGLEILKDQTVDQELEIEKVFITKTEKKCLEDIGNLAARTRTPLDDKHQRFFEKDRRKFANSITMPEVQEVEKAEAVPPEIISKTKETPVNITSTELDGLRSYLLQLKELIARRETAWARTTERDYNQRVEITRFKNEVSHLRMLCEKRQKDIKDRDEIIAAKDEEIRDLQKRVQGLRNAIMKLEKKEDKVSDSTEGMPSEGMENSHVVQRSYNAMKRQSMIKRATISSSLNLLPGKQTSQTTHGKSLSKTKDVTLKKQKIEKPLSRKVRPDSLSNDEEASHSSEKAGQTKLSEKEKPKTRHRSHSLVQKTKETFDKVDEKLQLVEEMLHNEVLKGVKKRTPQGRPNKNQTDVKAIIKNNSDEKSAPDFIPSKLKKLTPSNSKIRQEMLIAMTGLNPTTNFGIRGAAFSDPKRTNAPAALIANALLAGRNQNLFNY